MEKTGCFFKDQVKWHLMYIVYSKNNFQALSKRERQNMIQVNATKCIIVFWKKRNTWFLKWNLATLAMFESIRRGNFAKYLFLGVWSPRKSYLFLQNFEKALLECVLVHFASPGKFTWVLVATIFGSPCKISCVLIKELWLLENSCFIIIYNVAVF